MCVIWGIPYLLIRVAVADMSPAMLVLGRTAIAALLLLPIAAARGELRVLPGHWVPLLAFAVIEIALPWVAARRRREALSSSLTGLLIAAVPLVGAADRAYDRRRERLGRRRSSGSCSGSSASPRSSGSNREGASVVAARRDAPSRSATRSGR